MRNKSPVEKRAEQSMNLSRHHYRSGTAGGKNLIFIFSFLIVMTSIGSNADPTESNSFTLKGITKDVITRKPHRSIRGGSIGARRQVNNIKMKIICFLSTLNLCKKKIEKTEKNTKTIVKQYIKDAENGENNHAGRRE